MIVRITRVKVGQRQAPITAPCSLRYRGLCIFNSGVNLKLSHKKTLGHILPQRFFMGLAKYFRPAADVAGGADETQNAPTSLR